MAVMKSKVNVVSILDEAANTCRTPAITMGVNLIVKSLQRLAQRACEVNDPQILDELEFMCLVTRQEITPVPLEENKTLKGMG